MKKAKILVPAVVLPLLVAAFGAACGLRTLHRPSPSHTSIHRALGLLQYVGGDYSRAVSGSGTVLNADEYAEQLGFVDDVHAALTVDNDASPPDSLVVQLRELERLVTEQAPPQAVVTIVHALQRELVQVHDLQLWPDEAPDLVRGRQFYMEACAACHAGDGRAQRIAVRLASPPPDLTAEELDTTLSPYQVFNRMTFGVPGTAMPAFDTLSPAERWDIAFYVLAMRHSGHGDQMPCQADASLGSRLESPTLQDLARLTDQELGWKVAGRGVPRECLRVLVGHLRASGASSPGATGRIRPAANQQPH